MCYNQIMVQELASNEPFAIENLGDHYTLSVPKELIVINRVIPM